jgi:hypothetical protein
MVISHVHGSHNYINYTFALLFAVALSRMSNILKTPSSQDPTGPPWTNLKGLRSGH